MSTSVFLVGFMGAGKSTVGKLLAKKSGLTFIDLDAAIELVAGKSIAAIFLEQGESEFRKLENSVLQQLQQKENIVVATGGGCAANPNNLEFMKVNGTVVYLQVQPGVLFHRLAPEKKTRPLLSKLSDVALMELIMELLPERELFYKQAHLTVNGEMHPEQVSEEILSKVNHQSFSGLTERTS